MLSGRIGSFSSSVLLKDDAPWPLQESLAKRQELAGLERKQNPKDQEQDVAIFSF